MTERSVAPAARRDKDGASEREVLALPRAVSCCAPVEGANTKSVPLPVGRGTATTCLRLTAYGIGRTKKCGVFTQTKIASKNCRRPILLA